MMDFNNVYRSYKQRLINIDSRNSSFFLSKLLSKRHIDLVKISKQLNQQDELENGIKDTKTIIFSKLELNKDEVLKVFLEHDENYRDEIKSLIPFFKQSDFDYFEAYLEKAKDLKDLEHFVKGLIYKYESESLKFIQQFSKLEKQAKAIERDLGKNDLFLGYPFIEGKFPNGKNFRGPLVLHRIELIDYSDSVKIKIKDEGKMINPVFLLSYLNENGKDYQRFDFEMPDIITDYIKYAMKFLEANKISVKNSLTDYEIIDSITKADYEKKYFNEVNKFDIKNYCILGLFPISNRSIYDDLDYLDKNPKSSSKTLKDFLSGSKSFEDENDDVTPKESKIKYISPIDWSQRIVIKNALEKDLVIEGPPGTGKSQTIVNIIVNLLLQNKKILVVSEKLAAIEVVYNRLGRLRENTLIIKDYIRNKDDFFRQIMESESTLKNKYEGFEYNSNKDTIIEEYIHTLQKISKKEYYINKNFNEIGRFIKKSDEYPISLMQKTALKSLINSYDNLGYELDKIKNKLYNLISESTFHKRNIYDQVILSEMYKLYGYKGIAFFIEHNTDDYKLEHIKYNYFLYKAGKPLIPKYEHTFFDSGLSIREFNFIAFDKYVYTLYEKINKFKDSLLTMFDPIYQELNFDKKKVELALLWSNLKYKEKCLNVKKIYNTNFKQSFFSRLFNRPIELSTTEENFVNYLENYNELFDKKALNDVFGNMLYMDIIIGREFVSRNHSTVDDLFGLLLNSDMIKFKDDTFDRAHKLYNEMSSNLDIEDYIEIAQLSEEEKNVIDLCQDLKITDDFDDYINYLKIDSNVIEDVKRTEEYLTNFNSNYNLVKKTLEDKYSESFKTVYNQVKENIHRIFRIDVNLYREYSALVGQAQLKRRKSIKSIFDRYSNSIMAAFPVILMTPDVVSTVFHMKQDLFDYVIFDEASQMFIERAIPAIFRAKRVIVAGDSKQLKPSSTFQARLAESDELDEDENVSNLELEALDKESLLEMAKEKYTSKMIQFHYRSEHEELIEFSSAAFYERKLFFASKINDGRMKKPIEVINVKHGLWNDENTNPAEAAEVVRLIKYILEKRKFNETIGVITFNIKQKEYIQDLLFDEEDKLITDELNRTNPSTGDDESLFVKNIENVQGDERDIIIFSIGYARNKDGRITAQFGLLNKTGGENRLNVAITRAKKKIYIIKSISANELRVNEQLAGPLRLKQYLRFAELVSDQKVQEKNTLLNSIYDSSSIMDQDIRDFDSPFEQEVFMELSKVLPDNLSLKNQVNVGGFLIDIAVYDKNQDKFIIGIECDGYQYHSKPEDVERDFHRQLYLESRGWYIHRIISTNWFKNKNKEIEYLSALIMGFTKMN